MTRNRPVSDMHTMDSHRADTDVVLLVPVSFAKRVCNGFAQLGQSVYSLRKYFDSRCILGARGVSLTFSSGDGGVGDGNPTPPVQGCLTNDGRNVTRFLPLFPSSCPLYVLSWMYSYPCRFTHPCYSVTSVGGTVFVPERAVSFSGGGFSDVVCPWTPVFSTVFAQNRSHTVPSPAIPRACGVTVPEDTAQGDFCRSLQPVSHDPGLNVHLY